MDAFDALAQEHAALDALLGSLEPAEWGRPSACDGWTVADVVLHLAQSEELVGLTASEAADADANAGWRSEGATIDEIVDARVAAERGSPPHEILARWRSAAARGLERLRGVPDGETLAWATVPLKARTLATTRIAEHWIHATDIAGPLGREYPDTDRLWHIARLAHRTLPYAFARAGAGDAPSVRVELDAPDGTRWTFGEDGAECTLRGTASEFCRIAGRRLDPADSNVTATGTRAADVLALVRTYA